MKSVVKYSSSPLPPIGAICGSAFLLAGSLSAEDKVTYQDHVRPIFENKCFSCHNPDKAKGGLDLTTYSAALSGGGSGQVILSGEPGNSKIFNVITHAEEPVMPPKGEKMDGSDLDVIGKWLAGGLLDTSGSVAKKAEKPAFTMALGNVPTEKPEGPPPMPEHVPLEPVIVTASGNVVADIAVSPWAPLIAVTGQKQVLLHHAETLDLLGVLPYEEGFPIALSFSRNGSLILAGGGRPGKSGNVVAWDVKTGKRALEIGNEFDSVLGADINPSQTRIALGGPSKALKLYDTASGTLLKTVEKHTEWVMAVAFSPDGEYLASADRNGGLFVWEAETGNEVHALEGHEKTITAISWRPDSQALASCSEDGKIRLWETKEVKKVKDWDAHGGGALSVAFGADGNIVSSGRDGKVKIWKGDGGHLKDLAHEDGNLFVQVALTSGDKPRAISGDFVGKLAAYDTGSGEVVARTESNPPSIETRIVQANKLVAQTEQALAEATDDNRQELQDKLAWSKRRVDHWRAAAVNIQLIADRQSLAETETELGEIQSSIDGLKSDVAGKNMISETAEATVDHLAGKVLQAAAKVEELRNKIAWTESGIAALGEPFPTDSDERKAERAELEAALAAARAALPGAEAEQAAFIAEANRTPLVLHATARELQNLRNSLTVEVGTHRETAQVLERELAKVASLEGEYRALLESSKAE